MIPISAWEFRNPTRVIFGVGVLERLPTLLPGRALLVTTAGQTKRGVTQRVRDLYRDALAVHETVRSNPTVEQLADDIVALRDVRPDVVIGLGGGSAIDSAKVLRLGLAESTFDVRSAAAGTQSYDGIRPLPMVAIPTTAGTGSEVTATATVWDGSTRRKHSIAMPALFPSVAVVDPELALGLDWEATLSPGLDAYSQCFESIWNVRSSPMTNLLATRGLRLIPGALRTLRGNLTALDARIAMAEGALLSGLAISQTRTALAHSLSYPVTSHLGLPHGLACALFLLAVLEFNIEADDGRLEQLAGTGPPQAVLDDVRVLFDELEVAKTIRGSIGASPDLRALADQMLTGDRADNNLRPADMDDVRSLLAKTERWLAGSTES